jgi:hypothetical protein
MQIEDDVDYFEIRSQGERNLDWKYFAIGNGKEIIFIDDPIERYLEDVSKIFFYSIS